MLCLGNTDYRRRHGKPQGRRREDRRDAVKNWLKGLVPGVLLAALVGLSGWTLLEVVNLKVDVAKISTKLDMHMGQPQVQPTAVVGEHHESN